MTSGRVFFRPPYLNLTSVAPFLPLLSSFVTPPPLTIHGPLFHLITSINQLSHTLHGKSSFVSPRKASRSSKLKMSEAGKNPKLSANGAKGGKANRDRIKTNKQRKKDGLSPIPPKNPSRSRKRTNDESQTTVNNFELKNQNRVDWLH